MRATLLAATLLATGCSEPATKPTKSDPPAVAKATGASAPPAPVSPSATRPTPTRKAAGSNTPPAKKQDVPKKEPPTFKASFAAAVEIVKARESDEPAMTEKAMKLLTPIERGQADLAVDAARKGGDMWYEFVGKELRTYGLNALIASASSKFARTDKDFMTVAEAFWHPEMGATELATMMERWCAVDRFDRRFIVVAVETNAGVNGLTPAARNAALALGGRHWLER